VCRRQGPKQEKASVRISRCEIKSSQAFVSNVRLPEQNHGSAEILQDHLGSPERVRCAFRLDKDNPFRLYTHRGKGERVRHVWRLNQDNFSLVGTKNWFQNSQFARPSGADMHFGKGPCWPPTARQREIKRAPARLYRARARSGELGGMPQCGVDGLWGG